MELGDFLLPQVIGMVGQGLGHVDGLAPFLFLLVDLEQRAQRLLVARGAAQLQENFLGAIEQAGLEVVLAQFGQRMQALLVAQLVSVPSRSTRF